MATIDIFAAIDAESLPALSQDESDPTPGLGGYVHVLVTAGNVISYQSGLTLSLTSGTGVSAAIGDVIQWRALSLSGNFDKAVMFYYFDFISGDKCLSDPLLYGGVRDGSPDTSKEIQPLQGDAPWSGSQVAMPYHYFQSTVEAVGQVTYRCWFQVNDTHSGALEGYGRWEPQIIISSSQRSTEGR